MGSDTADDVRLSGPVYGDGRPNAVHYQAPGAPPTGLVVACPHSGQFYPPDMLQATRLDRLTLRRTEDAFVDRLFGDAPKVGADFFANTFARAYVDVNRAATELDPRLISGVVGGMGVEMSPRVQAGLGVIPRTLGDDLEIYQRQLDVSHALARIQEVHAPWHQALETMINRRFLQFGRVLLLDCHSMPSHSIGDEAADIILGDRFGSSCAPVIINEAARILKDQGFRVARNDPYPGGYTTVQYGNPSLGRHALQIEINRSLYMVEGAMTQRQGFETIRRGMGALMLGLSGIIASL